MKKRFLVLMLAGTILAACSSSRSQSSELTQSGDLSSSQSTSFSRPEESSANEGLTWSSMEEAITFYEKTITAELGEELAGIKLNGELYERDSWELIENSGDTMVLSFKNVGWGGKNAIEFKKGEGYTYITFHKVGSPYPENPISRQTVRNSDMVTVHWENLRPEENSSLSAYSAAEIEYARVWLEVIGNKDIEELTVSHISAGEPLNVYEKENSAVYPEDVVVLGGKTMADGSVIYSSNGNGTINLYEVPSHWQEGVVPEGKTMLEYTTDIVTHPVLVPISTGNEGNVIALIEKENITPSAEIEPFTAENAFVFLKEREGFNDDFVLKYSSYHPEDKYYELIIVSHSLKAQGGSGTVGIYHVYEDGKIVDTYAD